MKIKAVMKFYVRNYKKNAEVIFFENSKFSKSSEIISSELEKKKQDSGFLICQTFKLVAVLLSEKKKAFKNITAGMGRAD